MAWLKRGIAATLQTFDQAADFDRSLTLYLPAISAAGFTALQAIIAHSAGARRLSLGSCPNPASMRHDLLSECSEVLEAIDAEVNGIDNSVHIAEELGDLLMAATLMIQIATEAGRFQMADVSQWGSHQIDSSASPCFWSNPGRRCSACT